MLLTVWIKRQKSGIITKRHIIEKFYWRINLWEFLGNKHSLCLGLLNKNIASVNIFAGSSMLDYETVGGCNRPSSWRFSTFVFISKVSADGDMLLIKWGKTGTNSVYHVSRTWNYGCISREIETARWDTNICTQQPIQDVPKGEGSWLFSLNLKDGWRCASWKFIQRNRVHGGRALREWIASDKW